MSRRRPLVVKVGGSLLDWPGLPDRLARVIAQHDRPTLLIAGGGAIVDAIRRLDAVHRLGEESSHWLAIRALDLTARLLAESGRVGPVVHSPRRSLARWKPGQAPVLAPDRFLRRDDRRPGALPRSWAVTSDSIAARVAQRLDGDLLLLKSTPWPEGQGIDEAVRLGLVDPVFPTEAAELRAVWYRDLRDPDARDQPISPSGAGGSSTVGG